MFSRSIFIYLLLVFISNTTSRHFKKYLGELYSRNALIVEIYTEY